MLYTGLDQTRKLLLELGNPLDIRADELILEQVENLLQIAIGVGYGYPELESGILCARLCQNKQNKMSVSSIAYHGYLLLTTSP